MIFVSTVNLGNNDEEILPVNAEEFPFVCMYAEMDNYIGQSIPWHWHSYFEIDYISEGELELSTSNGTIHLKKGDTIFINSNVLHDIRVKNGVHGCKIYAHLFDMHFLSGMYNSIFEQNYVLPILRCKDLQTYAISPDSQRRIRMRDMVQKVIELAEKEEFGYEFEVRAELSRFWCMLLEETKDIRKQSSGKSDNDISRAKIMMHYIHENYSNKMSLEDIARTANISARESIRCFQRSIGMSPVNYLNNCRIRMAAKMLLQTDNLIMDIGENCGFSSNSYFGKVFRETFGCTPKEYRNKLEK